MNKRVVVYIKYSIYLKIKKKCVNLSEKSLILFSVVKNSVKSFKVICMINQNLSDLLSLEGYVFE